MNWSDVTDWLTEQGWKVLLVLAVSVAIYFILRHLVPVVLRRVVPYQMRTKDKDEIDQRIHTLSTVIVSTLMIIIGIVAIFTILAQIGVNIAPALLGFGVVGLAVGFGAQSLVKDIISGLFILLENQYGVGDVVKIAGIIGVVEQMNLRRTVLRDLDGIVHSVPNGEIAVASNYTMEWSRVNLDISVGYGENLDRVIEVINRVGDEMFQETYWGSLMLTPPKVLRVNSLGDSGIDIKILGDTKPIKQWEIMGELRKRIKRVFDEEGIEIPWPHTKVYFGEPLEHRQARKPKASEKRGEVSEVHKVEIRQGEEITPPVPDEE
ncbi:mechanosensitive ion channel family protein [Chloroflexota bacterium]